MVAEGGGAAGSVGGGVAEGGGAAGSVGGGVAEGGGAAGGVGGGVAEGGGAAGSVGGGVADGVVIVPMRRRHLRGVVAIEQQTNHRPWSLALFQGELRQPTSRRYVVALDGHRVVGYAGLMLTGFEGHITNVAVDPLHRRRHVATRLLLVLFREAIRLDVEDLTLEVRVTNRAAQDMYRGFGFAPGGVRPNYYDDIKEDALIMWAHGIGTDEGRDRLEELTGSLPVRLRELVVERAG